MQNDNAIAFSNFFGFLYIFANFEQLNLLLGNWIRLFQNFVNAENLIDYLVQNIDSIAFSNVFFGFLYIFPILKQLNLGNWNERWWCPCLGKFYEYFLFCLKIFPVCISFRLNQSPSIKVMQRALYWCRTHET